MLGHDSRSSVLLWFAKDNVDFGGKETGQLDNSASFEREKGLKKSIINVGWLDCYLMDMDMASVTIRSVVVGAVKKSGIKAIHKTQVV